MKRIVYISLVVSAIVAGPSVSVAQIGVNVDMTNGLDVNFGGQMRQTTGGNQYLYNVWRKGSVKQADGKLFVGIDLMYDLTGSRLIFKGDDGQPLAFANAVSEFTLSATDEDPVNRKFKNGFPAADGNKITCYYEVLSDGKIKLLKATQLKRVTETPTGQIYPSKFLKAVDTYYVLENGSLVKFKRDKKYIKELLKDKAQDFESYIASNKLDVKKDQDLSTIFDHYNSL